MANQLEQALHMSKSRNGVSSIIKNSLRCIAIILTMSVLASCASSYDVIAANGVHQQEIEKQSLRIVWKSGNSNIGVLKQQRGTGLQKPTLTDDEKDDALRAGNRILFALSSGLTGNISQKISGYMAPRGMSKYEMVVEMAQNVVSTQGNKTIVVKAYLRPAKVDRAQWARAIQVSLSNFESDNGIVEKFSTAIVAEMKNSGLVQ